LPRLLRIGLLATAIGAAGVAAAARFGNLGSCGDPGSFLLLVASFCGGVAGLLLCLAAGIVAIVKRIRRPAE